MKNMRFSYRVSLPDFDETSFTVALRRAAKLALNKAARSFLLAAVPRVPIFTGFARGAFGNLEDLVGRVQSNNTTINRKQKGSKRPQFLKSRNYYYYPSKGGRVIRNTISGRSFATQSNEIFDKGRVTIATGQSAFFFRYTIDITYFDYLDAIKWHSFREGADAFNVTLRDEFDKLKPKVGKFVTRKEVK